MEKAFTEIYDKNVWGDGSGTGSKLSRNNLKYIKMVEAIISENDIKNICDVGCGDWVFSQYINFGKCKYDGIDCVKSVVDANKKKFKAKNISFLHKSIGEDYIPKGYDLVIIKDVIQHWTDEDIIKYFTQILDNNKYVFCTNGYKFMRDPEKNKLKKRSIDNKYRYHPVDINKYPLSEFKDDCLSTETYHAKQMNLFKR